MPSGRALRPELIPLLRRQGPGAERGGGNLVLLARDLDIVDFGPTLGEGAIEGRQRIAGLAGGVHVEGAVEVGQIIDRPVARGVAVDEWLGGTEIHAANIERVVVTRARHA